MRAVYVRFRGGWIARQNRTLEDPALSVSPSYPIQLPLSHFEVIPRIRENHVSANDESVVLFQRMPMIDSGLSVIVT